MSGLVTPGKWARIIAIPLRVAPYGSPDKGICFTGQFSEGDQILGLDEGQCVLDEDRIDVAVRVLRLGPHNDEKGERTFVVMLRNAMFYLFDRHALRYLGTLPIVRAHIFALIDKESGQQALWPQCFPEGYSTDPKDS